MTSTEINSKPAESSELVTVANRFHDISEPMTIDNMSLMVSAIRLVDGVAHNFPPKMRADFHLYYYRLLKDNQDKLRSLDQQCTTIMQRIVEQALIDKEEKEKADREKQYQQQDQDTNKNEQPSQ